MRKNALYEIGHAVVSAYSRLLLGLDVHWHERGLPDGPKLFVANHPSATDPFIIHLLSRMSVMVTSNAFTFPLLGHFVRRSGQIPVRPGEGEQALEHARSELRLGHSVGIFPEGTFSPQQGGFGEPRTGAARLALGTGVPVIPIGIYLPRERSIQIRSRLGGRPTVGYWYLHGPYAVTVGRPVRCEGSPENQQHVRSTSNQLMESIRSLALESERRVRGAAPATVSQSNARS
jgi:1-acyl-sn-glycerol-3-phosphate acyltransferase